MKILPIRTDRESTSALQFKRKPSSAELKHYVPTIKEGLTVLNKELGFIIHNSSVPSNPKANSGIGTLLKKFSENLFIPFLAIHGFSTIQQEPNYIRRVKDPSPYDPLSTSKNIYMIPLEKLASEEYNFLIDKQYLEKYYTTNDERVDYIAVHENYNKILLSAYNKFSLLKNEDSFTPLTKEFEDFKTKKGTELEKNAMYEILSQIHDEENWKKWPETDRYLYDSESSFSRKEELKKNYEKEIDFHIFKQWLVEREIAKANNQNNEIGIKVIADTPIAFTPAEEWLNKDLFLEDLALGCPPDFFSREGQRWGFAVLNPKKIFNQDGSLGKGGEFLKNRYEAIFEASPGGVRIDHLIGLIDPFVYSKKEAHMTDENSGRLYTSPHKALLRDYSKYTDAEFTAIFDKIIFPAAAKFGIAKQNIICEDLGEQTPRVRQVIEKLNLTGLWVTQFGYSGVDAPEKNVIMLGAHDNQSYIEYTDDLFKRASSLGEGRDRFNYKTHILGSDTVIPGKDVNQYREELRSDQKKFMAASFAELFTSPAKKVQIFFTDFFGIGKTYNIPGSKKDCWTLRLPSNFEDLYYENLKNGIGVNLPQAIATAIRQKGEEFSSKHLPLLRKLDYFTHIFKN